MSYLREDFWATTSNKQLNLLQHVRSLLTINGRAARDRQTRKVRWNAIDEPIAYTAAQLDRAVVAEDQIRTIIQTFKDKLFTELSSSPDNVLFEAHRFPRAIRRSGGDQLPSVRYVSRWVTFTPDFQVIPPLGTSMRAP
jgi:hypothetical protein